MAAGLHRLVYFSRNRISDDLDVLLGAVDDILAASRRNNPRVGVTGALMFNAGCFGQVLEGLKPDIQGVFARIQRDRRHADVSLLAFEPITERSFGAWSMSFIGTRPRDAAAFSEIGRFSGFDPSQADGDSLFEALRTLALADEARRAPPSRG